MKALTLYQPWASLIACGLKTIETRSWATSYRGPVAIHAGQTLFGEQTLNETEPGFEELCRVCPNKRLPLGAIVAVAQLWACGEYNRSVNCLELPARDRGDGAPFVPISPERRNGTFGEGRFGWLLKDVVALNPVACRGRQGLWELPADVEALVRAQLAQVGGAA